VAIISTYTDEQREFVCRALTIVGQRREHTGRVEVRHYPTPWPDLSYPATALYVDGDCAMTTMPEDLLDHRSILEEAEGSVLLTGLGLGVGVSFALANQEVIKVTVVEKDGEVIDAIWPLFKDEARAEVIHVDADTFEPDEAFDFAYLDHRVLGDVPQESKDYFRARIPVVKVWAEEREAQCL